MAIQPGAEEFRADGGPMAVLMLHGFTGSPWSLRPWAEHHAAVGVTVRVPRLIGHGTSWRELNRTRWPDWYAGAERTLGELRERGHVVAVAGLSGGGALATRLAQTRPGDVAGLILVNPSIGDPDPRLRLLLPWLRWIVPSLGAITNDIAKPGVDERGYDRLPLQALWSLTRLWAAVRADLASVRCPLLVFRSTVDHVVPAWSTTAYLSGVSSPDIRVVELCRSHHVATLDWDAPLIMDESLDFVRRVTTDATRSPAAVPAGDEPGPPP